MTALLLAVTKGGHWGWSSRETLGLAFAALGMLLVWIPLQLRTRDPLIDLRSNARPVLLLVNLAAVVLGFGLYANLLVTTQLLQLPRSSGVGLGMDLLHAGLWMAPAAAAFGAVAPLSARIIGRLGARSTLLLGALTMAGSYVLRAFLSHELWQIVLGSVAVSVGTSLAYAAMPILIMSGVAVTETASANAVNTLLRTVGMSVSSAVAAAITTTVVVAEGVPTYAALASILWIAAVACILAAGATALLFRFRIDEDAVASPRVEPATAV
jgi:MFS family permease